MFFQRDRVLPDQTDQFKKQTQKVAVIVGFPFDALKDLSDVNQRVFDRGPVVCDGEGPDGGTADDDHLERQGFHDDPHLAAGHNIPAEYHDDSDNDADYADHEVSSTSALDSAETGRSRLKIIDRWAIIRSGPAHCGPPG